ncbi:MAG: hotdog fold thioesterase [Desulfatiglandales bacterium]
MDPLEILNKLGSQEPYRRFLGLKVLKIGVGYALVEREITEECLNIHGTTHGGLLFSVVDEAFELASNSHGTVAVALSMTVTFFRATGKGNVIRAEATEINRTKRTATYQIQVTDENQNLVAICQALVYRKEEPLPEIGP